MWDLSWESVNETESPRHSSALPSQQLFLQCTTSNYHQRYLASIYTKTKTCLTASHRNIIPSHTVKNFKLYKRPSTHTLLEQNGPLTTIKRRHVCNYWLTSNIPCLNAYTFHNHGTVCKSAHYIYEASGLEKRNFSATLGVYISITQLYK